MLERFVEYLRKRCSMIQYCEYILDNLVNCGKDNVTKDDFKYRFETSNPPNKIFTPHEMWCYYLKRNLGY